MSWSLELLQAGDAAVVKTSNQDTNSSSSLSAGNPCCWRPLLHHISGSVANATVGSRDTGSGG
jgi:hypothetical protein